MDDQVVCIIDDAIGFRVIKGNDLYVFAFNVPDGEVSCGMSSKRTRVVG